MRWRVGVLVGALCSLVASAAASAQTPPTPTTIPEMWNAWCARCHAKDGTGKVAEPTVKFSRCDFTECKSATGEGDPDWALAIAKGGPAVGLSDQMPAFGDSLKRRADRGLRRVPPRVLQGEQAGRTAT